MTKVVTYIVIDDVLLRRAQKFAEAHNMTLSELVEALLREVVMKELVKR